MDMRPMKYMEPSLQAKTISLSLRIYLGMTEICFLSNGCSVSEAKQPATCRC